MLWRLSGNPDPVTLIPTYLEFEGQNDFFVYRDGGGLLPIRAAINPAISAEDYLATLETVVFEAYQHRNMSEDVTVLDLATTAQGGRLRLSEVQFSLERAGTLEGRNEVAARNRKPVG